MNKAISLTGVISALFIASCSESGVQISAANPVGSQASTEPVVTTDSPTIEAPVVVEGATIELPGVVEGPTTELPVTVEGPAIEMPTAIEGSAIEPPVVIEGVITEPPVVIEGPIEPVVIEGPTAPIVIDGPSTEPIVVEGPIEEQPVVIGGPSEEPPVITAGPSEEPPVVTEGPSEEPPVVTEGPTEEPPVVAEGPTEEPPVVTEGPTEEPPVVTEGPAEEPAVTSPTPTRLEGQVTAGYAQCDVYASDLSSNLLGEITRSDSEGEFTIDLAEYRGEIVITASNCEYTDELTNDIVDNATFRSFVLTDDFAGSESSGILNIQVTPFTELVFSYAKTSTVDANPSAIQLKAADAEFERVFESMGFSYRTTAPVVATDPAAFSVDEASRDYGLALAALSGSGELSSELAVIEEALDNDLTGGLALLSDKLIDGAAAFELTGQNEAGKSSIVVALASLAANAPSQTEETQAPASAVAEFSVVLEPGLGTTRYVPWEDLFTDADTVQSSLTYRVVGEVCGDIVVSRQELALDCETPGEYQFFVTAMDPEGNVTVIPATVNILTENSDTQASAFLMSASFGPTGESIEEVLSQGYSQWFQTQLGQPISSILDRTIPRLIFSDTSSFKWETVPREFWYKSAVYGDDQLRQRTAFALSQLFVASTAPREMTFKARMHARYMDIIQEGTFGNFRDLLEDVTYSPMMGMWLTYIGNQKADTEAGRSPDENYAREVMQLFTVGLVELNQDGSRKLDAEGQAIEIYDNTDITELAKVFTGLWWDSSASPDFGTGVGRPSVVGEELPMQMYDEEHSPFSKTFLGSTIPAGLSGNDSISAALDILFNHPNVAPFVSKQLIQRMTTSNPSAAYVKRVADVFDSGSFTLPDGQVVGTGTRGDLEPVWAAILFDPLAVDPNRRSDETFGKVREPIIRFLHWARVAEIGDVEVLNEANFVSSGTQSSIEQNPYRATSVFNFYRPGYVATGSATGNAGLVAPEMQITHSTTAINYANLMHNYINRSGVGNWSGNYDPDIRTLAENADDLIHHLDLVLTAGRMSDQTKQRITDTLAPVDPDGNLLNRIKLAVLLTVNSQEYITQQ